METRLTRRGLLRGALLAGAGLAAARRVSASPQRRAGETPPGQPNTIRMPVETPDLPKLSWDTDNGTKVFRLVAEPVRREFIPGQWVDAWGYNGTAPGPAIEANQGDRVRVIFENHLPEPTSIHWHGLEIPIEQDGVPDISQPPVLPGERHVYEFTLHQSGTFFYHSHMAMQEMMGMVGLFLLHPKEATEPQVDRDFGLIFQEWAVLPNNTVPNSMSMEFNWLTINGRSGPACTPLLVRLGERVRIRMVNLGMDHHPIHLHGNTFFVTGTEAGRAPASAWRPENTVLLGVAQARDVEFDARYPGDWMLHCHLPHHMMNQMSSMVGPLTRAPSGMPTGLGMEEGMGIIRRGGALGPENGASFGRGMGFGPAYDRATTNSPLLPVRLPLALSQQKEPHHMQHGAPHAGQVSPGANSVPGFPQDAFMEGPHMAMDDAVEKPENFGLPHGWSGFTMGMMTFVRVLPQELFDRIQQLRNSRKD